MEEHLEIDTRVSNYVVQTEIELTPDEYEVYTLINKSQVGSIGFSCEGIRYILEDRKQVNLTSYYVRDILNSLLAKQLIKAEQHAKKIRYYRKDLSIDESIPKAGQHKGGDNGWTDI